MRRRKWRRGGRTKWNRRKRKRKRRGRFPWRKFGMFHKEVDDNVSKIVCKICMQVKCISLIHILFIIQYSSEIFFWNQILIYRKKIIINKKRPRYAPFKTELDSSFL